MNYVFHTAVHNEIKHIKTLEAANLSMDFCTELVNTCYSVWNVK